MVGVPRHPGFAEAVASDAQERGVLLIARQIRARHFVAGVPAVVVREGDAPDLTDEARPAADIDPSNHRPLIGVVAHRRPN